MSTCRKGGNGPHQFAPGVTTDEPDNPNPRWCNVCGESRGTFLAYLREWWNRPTIRLDAELSCARWAGDADDYECIECIRRSRLDGMDYRATRRWQ
jgi:hypothetical protein